MKYGNVTVGKFIERPNRFVAMVNINGSIETCHVKNTGRCKELLVPGAEVYLEKSKNPDRKTKYDLIAVKKGERLINMDSQAPNKAAGEYLEKSLPGIKLLKPEVKFNNSRFDFYAETDTDKWFIEVKGVTLEKDGVVMFPDAPTQRGVKHINELCLALDRGYKASVLFIVQMKNVKYFTPNYETHPDFGAALKNAKDRGVIIKAVECEVSPSEMRCIGEIEVKLK